MFDLEQIATFSQLLDNVVKFLRFMGKSCDKFLEAFLSNSVISPEKREKIKYIILLLGISYLIKRAYQKHKDQEALNNTVEISNNNFNSENITRNSNENIYVCFRDPNGSSRLICTQFNQSTRDTPKQVFAHLELENESQEEGKLTRKNTL